MSCRPDFLKPKTVTDRLMSSVIREENTFGPRCSYFLCCSFFATTEQTTNPASCTFLPHSGLPPAINPHASFRASRPKEGIFSADRNYIKQFHALHKVKTINHSSPFRNHKGLMENEICSFLIVKLSWGPVR
jgi:hypothetical protein